MDATGADSEDDFVLEIVANTKVIFTGRAEVLQTRLSRCFMTLAERVQLANNSNADVFVSIHLNANVDRTVHGSEVLIEDRGNADALRLAQLLLQSQLLTGLTQFSTGIEERPDLVVLNSTNMTAALAEVAFISNSILASGQTTTDENLLDNPTFRQHSASIAIETAISQFLGL